MTTDPDSPASRPNRVVLTVLDIAGRTMIAAGLLLLLFVAYQLWGTGLAESRSQSDLAAQFETLTESAADNTTQGTIAPTYGGVVSRIEIPRIDVDKFVVAGVDAESLRKGPGLFPGSPLAGQLGNVAITGHRTTYGAPFSRINEMTAGDEVIIHTPKGPVTYIVDTEPFVVEPTRTEVARTNDPNRAMLTLISCHPKWTSEQRIVVTATLAATVEPQQPTEFLPTEEAPIPVALSEGWFHDPAAWPWVILWFVALMALYAAAVIATRKGVRAFVSYPVMAIVMAPTLFIFFEQLSRLLPTNL